MKRAQELPKLKRDTLRVEESKGKGNQDVVKMKETGNYYQDKLGLFYKKRVKRGEFNLQKQKA